MDAFANPSQLLLDLLPQYGYLALGLATFLGAAGLPVPLTPLLLAAGALTTQGGLQFPATVLATWLAAVAGDCAGYLIGHLAGRRLVRRVGPRFGLST